MSIWSFKYLHSTLVRILRVIIFRSSWQDADALEEELQEGQIRLQAEEAQPRGLLPGDQGEEWVEDGSKPKPYFLT